MTHVHGMVSKSFRVVSCLTLAFVAVGCSGADLGSSTGTTPVGTTGTGGASGTSTSTASGQTGGTPGTSTNANTGGSATTTTGGGSSASAPTWTKLYSSYFGAGTAGDCVSCHGAGTSPAFTSASTLCTVLKQRKFVPGNMAGLITWLGGASASMPPSGAAAPANAVADINAWQAAGSVCP